MIKKIIDFAIALGNRIYHRSYYKRFNSIGKRVYLGLGVKIDFPECVIIENEVYINDFTWITVLKYNFEKGRPVQKREPLLFIGEGTYIGHSTVISCVSKIEIDKKVLIADRCFICDGCHGYQNKFLPIIDQYLFSPGPVRIGEGSWLGINVCVLPNVSIGKHCVIGANSVVTKDMPDYSIAVGSPAKVIKRIE